MPTPAALCCLVPVCLAPPAGETPTLCCFDFCHFMRTFALPFHLPTLQPLSPSEKEAGEEPGSGEAGRQCWNFGFPIPGAVSSWAAPYNTFSSSSCVCITTVLFMARLLPTGYLLLHLSFCFLSVGFCQSLTYSGGYSPMPVGFGIPLVSNPIAIGEGRFRFPDMVWLCSIQYIPCCAGKRKGGRLTGTGQPG